MAERLPKPSARGLRSDRVSAIPIHKNIAMPNTELLTELHGRLWESLRHVLNTDRILLAVTYVINFAGFVMLSLAAFERPLAAVVSIAALALLNGLVMLSLANSRREAVSLLNTLVLLYADHQLNQ
jgi:hypothetical protein